MSVLSPKCATSTGRPDATLECSRAHSARKCCASCTPSCIVAGMMREHAPAIATRSTTHPAARAAREARTASAMARCTRRWSTFNTGPYPTSCQSGRAPFASACVFTPGSGSAHERRSSAADDCKRCAHTCTRRRRNRARDAGSSMTVVRSCSACTSGAMPSNSCRNSLTSACTRISIPATAAAFVLGDTTNTSSSGFWEGPLAFTILLPRAPSTKRTDTFDVLALSLPARHEHHKQAQPRRPPRRL